MRRSMLISAVMAAVVFGSAAPPMGAVDRLVGELVDSACYAQRGSKATGADHANCATTCAQKGQRLSLLTSTGDVYVVTGVLTENNNAKLIPLIAKTVALTGTVTQFLASATTAVSVGDLSSPIVGPTLRTDDGRRRPGTDDGVVSKKIRRGDFREGDNPDSPEMAIDAIGVEIVTLKIQ